MFTKYRRKELFKKRFFLFFLVLNTALLLHGYTPDPSLEEKVRKCVVKVLLYDADGKPAGSGTGFFVASTKIITNRHVVKAGERAEIKSIDGEIFPVQGIAAYDQILDLVLLEVDVPFGKFDYLSTSSFLPNKGDTVIIIGNPWGKGPRTATGSVTNIHEWQFVGKVMEYDAPTFPGNSGSPVFTTSGYVIGIATWGALGSQTPRGFAIPYERVLNLEWGTIQPLDEWNRRMKDIDSSKQYFENGRQSLKRNDYAGALSFFKKAVELNPEFAEAWALLGYCKYKTGLFDEAVGDYNKATRYRHDFLEAYYYLALAYEGMSRLDEAVDAYEQALMIKPDYADARFRLGNVYIEKGDRKAAEEQYRELLDLDSLKAKTLRMYIEKKFSSKSVK